MPAEIKVVDASAVAALLFAEPRADEAADLFAGSFLVAPTLLRYEIGSVCLKKLRNDPDQQDALLEAHSMLDLLGIQEVDVPLKKELLLLAERERLTVYDSAYLWLARSLRASLVTFDEELARASLRRNFLARHSWPRFCGAAGAMGRPRAPLPTSSP